jgi:hypothetical protein
VTLRLDPDVIDKFREGGRGMAEPDQCGFAEGGWALVLICGAQILYLDYP